MRDHSIPITTEDTTEEIPYGYCHCGCGQKTRLVKATHSANGLIRGEPRRFVNGHQQRCSPSKIEMDQINGIARIHLNSQKYPGLVAIIDIEDVELVRAYRWFPKKNARQLRTHFYVRANDYSGPVLKDVFPHRLLMRPPDDCVVDHINGDTLDNRRENLRVTSISNNTRNCLERKQPSSGFYGVSRDRGRWRARVSIDGKTVSIGSFDTAEEAAVAYDEVAVEHYGQFVRINFPDRFQKSQEIEVTA